MWRVLAKGVRVVVTGRLQRPSLAKTFETCCRTNSPAVESFGVRGLFRGLSGGGGGPPPPNPVAPHQFLAPLEVLEAGGFCSVGARLLDRHGRGQDLAAYRFALKALGHIARVAQHRVVQPPRAAEGSRDHGPRVHAGSD